MDWSFLRPSILKLFLTILLLAIPFIDSYPPIVLLFSYLYLMEILGFLMILGLSALVYIAVSFIVFQLKRI